MVSVDVLDVAGADGRGTSEMALGRCPNPVPGTVPRPSCCVGYSFGKCPFTLVLCWASRQKEDSRWGGDARRGGSGVIAPKMDSEQRTKDGKAYFRYLASNSYSPRVSERTFALAASECHS